MMCTCSSPSTGNLRRSGSFGVSDPRGPEGVEPVTGGFVLPPSNSSTGFGIKLSAMGFLLKQYYMSMDVPLSVVKF
ncbi:hypothetical protein GBAR_LOCUS11583 [Geodia barretti]|uniref:Uncharacterized protein n=1 Tax=Geodia barretti TaxID=519541 RepID=A0AA35WG38_GEOBA|nr:hypothetical protein GBAR_LOCUS11583 [Geodia barretti]